jgi:hypothetical protein
LKGEPAIPRIDPNVRHRQLNAETLRAQRETLVVQDGETPLVVVLPYDVFMEIQERLVMSEGERRAGLRDAQ